MIICNKSSKVIPLAQELGIPFCCDNKEIKNGIRNFDERQSIIRFDNYASFSYYEPRFAVYNNGKRVIDLMNKKRLFMNNKGTYVSLQSPSLFDYNQKLTFDIIGKSGDCRKTIVFNNVDEYIEHFKNNANDGWFYYHRPFNSVEYRVHCAHGKVIAAYKKSPCGNNEKNFTRIDLNSELDDTTQKVLFRGLRTLRSHHIDFGYTDVLCFKEKAAYIFLNTDINAIPNLSIPELREFYALYFSWLIHPKWKENFNFDRAGSMANAIWNLEDLKDKDFKLSPSKPLAKKAVAPDDGLRFAVRPMGSSFFKTKSVGRETRRVPQLTPEINGNNTFKVGDQSIVFRRLGHEFIDQLGNVVGPDGVVMELARSAIYHPNNQLRENTQDNINPFNNLRLGERSHVMQHDGDRNVLKDEHCNVVNESGYVLELAPDAIYADRYANNAENRVAPDTQNNPWDDDEDEDIPDTSAPKGTVETENPFEEQSKKLRERLAKESEQKTSEKIKVNKPSSYTGLDYSFDYHTFYK